MYIFRKRERCTSAASGEVSHNWSFPHVGFNVMQLNGLNQQQQQQQNKWVQSRFHKIGEVHCQPTLLKSSIVIENLRRLYYLEIGGQFIHYIILSLTFIFIFPLSITILSKADLKWIFTHFLEPLLIVFCGHSDWVESCKFKIWSTASLNQKIGSLCQCQRYYFITL